MNWRKLNFIKVDIAILKLDEYIDEDNDLDIDDDFEDDEE